MHLDKMTEIDNEYEKEEKKNNNLMFYSKLEDLIK